MATTSIHSVRAINSEPSSMLLVCALFILGVVPLLL